MPVFFPELDHVPLRNSPLREVVCQVRFPLILKIAQSVPVEFQETIRGRFPDLQVERAMLVGFPPDPSQPAQAADSPPIYRFLDQTKTRIVSLAPDFFAVSTTKYEGWDRFRDDVKVAAQAAMEVYKIPYSTRIGLRYINTLTASNTKSMSFSEIFDMLRPELVTLLQTREIQEPFQSLTQIRVRNNDSTFLFHSGIVKEQDEAERPAFVLDFDQFIEDNVDLKVEDLLQRCDQYHAIAYNAFRWCILPEKLAIFEPIR